MANSNRMYLAIQIHRCEIISELVAMIELSDKEEGKCNDVTNSDI